MGEYRPGSLPEPRENVASWAKQFSQQLRSELLTISKLLNQQAATTTTPIRTVGGGGGSTVVLPPAIVGTHDILSATHSDTLAQALVLGDILYANSTPLLTVLAGNITTTKKFITQTGTGAISAAPAWNTIVDSDVPDILTITKLAGITTDGFVKTSGGDGTLGIDTTAYISGVVARKNSGANVGTRPRINFIEGTNVTLTVADDAGDNEIDLTIAASGTGGSSGYSQSFLLMGG